eukprot:CAMPEP_0202414028 /NCGR_PEP_ID=MMETSP1128-20130828/31570_1 /ASSEMBLY_ACC=CAM_ASM_000463 /TAXON_ID=3047 /ORGANISM="Dunaliella tertiolecta, Strain CCMP1320" /LENGTH=69 /DNA_ID=CAMNT_0049020355 /DNA_START=103 /DNA_END=309 /DNA_ORIENTATION=+
MQHKQHCGCGWAHSAGQHIGYSEACVQSGSFACGDGVCKQAVHDRGARLCHAHQGQPQAQHLEQAVRAC